MTDPERGDLPEERVWQDDGHLTEVALTALADGEETLVPHAAQAHVRDCDGCAARLADAALVSAVVTEALHGSPAHAVVPVRRRPLPLSAVAAALVLASLGALPQLVRAPSVVGDAAVLVHALPALARSALVVSQSAVGGAGEVAGTASFVATGVMLLAGLIIARTMPRQLSRKGRAS